jgi:hypothetical protein
MWLVHGPQRKTIVMAKEKSKKGKGVDPSGGQHSPYDREKRIALCEQYLARGITNQYRLGELLGVTQQTVSRYILDVIERWKAIANQSREQTISSAIARYSEIYTTALEHFEESGDKQFLDVAIKAQERIDKVMGTEAPVRHHHNLLQLMATVGDAEIHHLENTVREAIEAKSTVIEAELKE